VTLAISLHAATDELRDRLVPVNRAHPLDALIAAAGAYARVTGRRLSLEWCLIGGVNDGLDQATGLVRIARRLRAHVNVIPMNRIEGSPWGPPPADVSRAFLRHLSQAALTVTVRDTRGGEADAACGQLRASLETRRQLRPDGTLGPQRSGQRGPDESWAPAGGDSGRRPPLGRGAQLPRSDQGSEKRRERAH
jgi:23S rRNA (adenine2503-C2)-methyltransferase